MKNFEWKLACRNCGFEFEILFDELITEQEKAILRKCHCGCEMIIEEEKSWESEGTGGMNKITENRDIEQNAVIEYLKPKKPIISYELLECPCAKKTKTNFDKITQSVESLAEFLAPRIVCGDCPYWKNRNCVASLPCEEALTEWLQKESE